MAAAFVHGVPETPTVWAPLVDALDRHDTALVQLPGFGCRLADGFGPTMYRYADRPGHRCHRRPPARGSGRGTSG